VRWLSKTQLGVWALFLTIITIFEATKSGLLKNAHIKFVSSSKDKKERSVIASSSFIINASITILFIFLLIFFASWLNKLLNTGNDLSLLLKLFIPGLIGMVFFSHLEAIQQSHLDFKGVSAGYIIRQISFFVLILFEVVYHSTFSLINLAIYQSISIILGTIILYFSSRKYVLHVFTPTKLWMKKIVGYGGYIFGSGVASNICANVDQLMTASFISSTSVSYYNVATRINNLIDIPSYAAAEILFPKTAQAAAEEEKSKVKYLYERMVGILLSFIIPTLLFILLFPKFVIGVIAGSQYELAAPILQLYILTGLIRPMQNQAANLLNSIGKPALCFYLNIFSLLFNLVLNYIFLQTIGFYGAAVGTLCSIFVSSVLWYLIMKKQISVSLPNIFKYTLEGYKNMYGYAVAFLRKKV
jgi:O-antigen/teichoic acid export membrane protein